MPMYHSFKMAKKVLRMRMKFAEPVNEILKLNYCAEEQQMFLSNELKRLNIV